MNLKKGAMFGLDARIALAIFGALSVISGAALYSAIQESKAVALITSFQEMAKAWEAYYLDTGSNLPQASNDPSSDNFYRLKSDRIVQNTDGLPGWAGPYLPYEVSSTQPNYLTIPGYYELHYHILNDEETWGAPDSHWSPNGKCTSGKKCSMYVVPTGYDDLSIIQTIDEKVDGSDGAKKGKFRWYDSATNNFKYVLFYRITGIKNPND